MNNRHLDRDVDSAKNILDLLVSEIEELGEQFRTSESRIEELEEELKELKELKESMQKYNDSL